MMNKKGIIYDLFLIMAGMFVIALVAIIAAKGWNTFDGVVQNASNETIPDTVKAQVHDLGYIVGWNDKLLVAIFISLFIAFLITCATSPVESPIYALFFAILLIVSVVIAMVISNGWTYIAHHPDFITEASRLAFTDYFFRYLPIIMFFVGIAGGLIFYGRWKGGMTYESIQ